MKTEISRARINIKSLAAEAEIIRKEIRKSSDVFTKNCLHSHRVTKVRPEARLALLALGFLKGRKRSRIEISAKEIDVNRLYNKICGFVMGIRYVKKEELITWLADNTI